MATDIAAAAPTPATAENRQRSARPDPGVGNLRRRRASTQRDRLVSRRAQGGLKRTAVHMAAAGPGRSKMLWSKGGGARGGRPPARPRGLRERQLRRRQRRRRRSTRPLSPRRARGRCAPPPVRQRARGSAAPPRPGGGRGPRKAAALALTLYLFSPGRFLEKLALHCWCARDT